VRPTSKGFPFVVTFNKYFTSNLPKVDLGNATIVSKIAEGAWITGLRAENSKTGIIFRQLGRPNKFYLATTAANLNRTQGRTKLLQQKGDDRISLCFR
jgi:hypothetical protein